MLSTQELQLLLEEEAKLRPAPWVIEGCDGSMIYIGTECKSMKGCVDLECGHAYAISRCPACVKQGDWDEHPCLGGKSNTHKTVVAMRNVFREVVEEVLALRARVQVLEEDREEMKHEYLNMMERS
jgi:hypothetical protein